MATPPKRHLEKQFARISRQSHAFQPIFIPDQKGKLKQSLGFIITNALRKSNMMLAALMVVPRGYIAIAFDRDARRSTFMQVANHRISREIRKTQKHEESIWTNGKPGDIAILDPDALKKAIVETLSLPIRLGYVRKLSDWPSLVIGPEDWGEAITFTKRIDPPKSKDPQKGKRTKKAPLIKTEILKAGLPESLFSKEEIASLKEEIQHELAKIEAQYRRKVKRVIGPQNCFFKKYFRRTTPKFRFEIQYKKSKFLSTCKKRLDAAVLKLTQFREEYERIRRLFLDHQTAIRDADNDYPSLEDVFFERFPAGTVKLYWQWKFKTETEESNDVHLFLKIWVSNYTTFQIEKSTYLRVGIWNAKTVCK